MSRPTRPLPTIPVLKPAVENALACFLIIAFIAGAIWL